MAYRFKHGDRPIDGYTIQRAVGAGGFGEVYYAISDGGREVALKYLRDNPQVELRGISHCINLKSPHLVSIFDVKKSEEGDYFVVMEYCSGPSLRDLLIAEPNGFSTEKAAFFAREIAKGLAYLHDRGIVHRDLKPGNIFFDDGYVKIGDYGLSKFISVSRHSAQTASVGTVHYMAPEIGSGNYQRGVDIYALGVMVYEMLLGRVPFEGSSMGEVLMAHLTRQPQVDELPEPFGQVIRRALEKDPKDRYQTVDEMITEVLSGETVQKSLAGFSPDSLSGAVRRGSAEPMISPMPSPNPSPRRERIVRLPDGEVGRGPLPDRVSQRINRISRKIDQKVAKLGGKVHVWGTVDRPQAARKESPSPSEPKVARRIDVLPPGNRSKRIGLSVAVALAVSIGVGVLFGNAFHEDVGVGAAMLVAALTGSVPITRKVINWLASEFQPTWAKRLAAIGCTGPLLFLAAVPVLEKWDERGIVIVLSLLVVAVFGDWSKEIDRGAVGELSIGGALWKGFGALAASFPVCFVTSCEPDDFMFVAPVIAAAACLNIQAASWWLRRAETVGENERSPGRGPQGPMHRDTVVVEPATFRRNADLTMTSIPTASASQPSTEKVESKHNGPFDDVLTRATHVPPGMVLRGNLTRMFWALVAFASMCASIVMILFAAMGRMGNSGRTQAIIMGIGFGCATLFSLSKTAPLRRIGFWGTVFRPVLISVALFAIGTSITFMVRGMGEFREEVFWNFPDGFASRPEVAHRTAVKAREIIKQTRENTPLAKKSKGKGWETKAAPEPPPPPSAPSEPVPPEDTEFTASFAEWREPSNERPTMIIALVVSSLVLAVLLLDSLRRPKAKTLPNFMKSDPGQPVKEPAPAGQAS